MCGPGRILLMTGNGLNALFLGFPRKGGLTMGVVIGVLPGDKTTFSAATA